MRLKFSTVSTSASKQRTYHDEIKVAENTSASISGVKADKTSTTVYDLQGRKANVNGRGIVIVNGKKMVR